MLPQLYSWTMIPESKLILIGISNAIALTDDFRKHLTLTVPNNETTVIQQLVFAPYTQVIITISYLLMDVLMHSVCGRWNY